MRHGEVHNPDKVLYGRLPDFHLSERGRARRSRWRTGWPRNDIVYVVASPLERAQETAAPIAADARPGHRHRRRPRSSRGTTSRASGCRPGDGALRNPRNWWQLRNPRTPSWGEPYVEIAARMQAALYRARVTAAGHEAVCVSHQLPVETLRRAMTGRTLHHLPLPRQPDVQPRVDHVVHFHDDALVGWGYSEPWRPE